MKLFQYLNEEDFFEYNIYCDMDGVLCDFIGAANKLAEKMGYSGGWEPLPEDEKWEIINKEGFDFWANLDWMPDGKKLWSLIKPYRPKLLSAYVYTVDDPMIKMNCILGKLQWIKENLGEYMTNRAIICRRDEKELWAGDDNILIDDMEKNVREWENAGGIGIVHKGASKTIKELESML